MEKLIVSMMRFSTAMTLFGIDQLQNTMNLMGGRDNLDESIDKFRAALDSLTDAVAEEMDEKKRETLKSFTRASKDAVDRTFEGMNLGRMDPSGMWQTTADMMKKTTETMADWMSGGGGEAEEESAEPQPAAEALSGSKGGSGKTARK